MATRKRRTTRKTEKDVTAQVLGTSFVVDGGHARGTPSNTERKGVRGAYAASSVIERGTATKMKAEFEEEAEHLCICGCGQQPSQPDSLFMPGHDSKVRAMGKAVLEGHLDKKQVPAPALKYLEEGGMLG